MSKRTHATQSAWLSLVASVATPANSTTWSGAAITIPFLQFGDTYNAIELYKIDYDAAITADPVLTIVGAKNLNGVAGGNYQTYASDKSTVSFETMAVNAPSQQSDLTDNVGHGVLYPAQTIYLNAKNFGANNAQVIVARIYYRLRKISDRDLLGIVNQYIQQN